MFRESAPWGTRCTSCQGRESPKRRRPNFSSAMISMDCYRFGSIRDPDLDRFCPSLADIKRRPTKEGREYGGRTKAEGINVETENVYVQMKMDGK